MNRLDAELQRLNLLPATGRPAADASVGALRLELVDRAGWEPVARVWQGVQAELDLPAPAIAVNGRDGYQLWFAFAEPVAVAEVRAFADGLRKRYLAELPPERIRLDGDTLPPAQVATERWAAFVAPDLAPLFAEEPWLDLAPSADAQAELLSRVQTIRPIELRRAGERLRAADAPPAPTMQASRPPTPAPAAAQQEPRAFLLQVMNDPAVELPLRIEAAKALLAHGTRERGE